MSVITSNGDLGIPKFTIGSALKLLKLISTRINTEQTQGIFLWGPPGIGKSDLVKELARSTNRKFIDIRLSTIDPVDLRGLPQIDPNSSLTTWLPPDFLPQKTGEPGILFLDEINAAPPSIQAAAYQLILDRKVGNYQVPDDWIIISAGNRLSDKSVAFRIPTALANRFSHFEIVVEPNEWYQWAWKNKIDPFIISFLRHQPGLLHVFNPDSNQLAFPTPRSWAFASSFEDVREVDLELYYKGIHGTVGSAAAQQFLSFLKHKDKLPNPDDVLEGRNYKAPLEPDAQYVMLAALIQSLTTNLSESRIANYFTYVGKYKKTEFADYQVILVKELLFSLDQKDEEGNDILRNTVINHSSYKKWSSENMSLFT